MGATVTINGREYPARLALFGLENELSSGAFPEAIEDIRAFLAPELERPDVDAAVRDGIAAARALQPAPHNRHERRKVAALRRRGEML